jgi:hypothetical protein
MLHVIDCDIEAEIDFLKNHNVYNYGKPGCPNEASEDEFNSNEKPDSVRNGKYGKAG